MNKTHIPTELELSCHTDIERSLIRLLFELENNTITKEELIKKVEKKGIFNQMKGPFKHHKVWKRMMYGLELDGDDCPMCIGVKRYEKNSYIIRKARALPPVPYF